MVAQASSSLCRRCLHAEQDHAANHCAKCRECGGFLAYTAYDLERRLGLQPGLTGADLLRGSNRQAAIALRDVLLARAQEARHDRAKFFEFVMRTEKGHLPMRIQPHQRLAFEFIQAHDRMVFMWSVEHSKTTLLVAEILADLGENPDSTGVFLCAAQEQAAKVIRVVRDYIEASAELRMVYPGLRPSRRAGDPWTNTTIVVDRPRGSKDPSLYAIGLDGQIQGSRLTRAYVDDLLNRENTATPEQRAKSAAYVNSSVLDRMRWGPSTKVIVSNVPWHPKDLVHAYTEPDQGGRWPLLRMSMEGEVVIRDDEDKRLLARDLDLPWEPFQSDLIRPATDDPHDLACRLVANDPDPENKRPLWPAAFPPERIAKLRGEMLPFEYNRKYRCVVRDDNDAMCKQEYIDRCLARARALGVKTLVSSYAGSHPVFLGLDLAVSPGEEADDTAFFVFEVRPDGTRVILDIDYGHLAGPEILAKLVKKIDDYKVSCARVENNGCQQYIIDFALAVNIALPIQPETTGRTKAHPDTGVPGVFLELSHGAWAIPNVDGQVHPRVKRFIDACLYYVPSKHTDDVLMAAFFARQQARAWGMNGPHDDGAAASAAGGVGVNLMAR